MKLLIHADNIPILRAGLPYLSYWNFNPNFDLESKSHSLRCNKSNDCVFLSLVLIKMNKFLDGDSLDVCCCISVD